MEFYKGVIFSGKSENSLEKQNSWEKNEKITSL